MTRTKRICKECGRESTLGVNLDYYEFIIGDDFLKEETGFICDKCWIERMGIKKLYHVSKDCNSLEELTAKVPSERREDEENTIGRVCLSSSIEGALSAVPWGGKNLEDYTYSHELIRVYEFDISDIGISSLVSPDCLYQSDMVRDAVSTREFWSINSIKPSRSYLIEIDGYFDELADDISYANYLNYINNGEMNRDGSYVMINTVNYNIVPEEDRSGKYSLDHVMEGMSDGIIKSIVSEVKSYFPSKETNIEILYDKDINRYKIKGTLDTSFMEVSKKRVIGMINHILTFLSISLKVNVKIVEL